ncbi:MAG: DEAD/DEAH box helicase [Pseudomonadales bacterium]|nr:DEAD/DEAH box helicase [Pseudomonadales bacterium]
MSFSDLGLKPSLLQAVSETGYTTPTPIQLQAIPAILGGGDVMAAAQTGTGKTAGFTLPLLQRLGGKAPVPSNHVRALILTPTRELAAQIQESIETYGKHEALRSVVVFGGVNINPQQMALRKGCDILVATPGRLLDLYQQNAVKFSELEILVLDEADRMLDMGFIRDIRKILALLPKQRQNLMFSATFSPEIRELAKGLCVNAQEIDVAPRNSTVDTITQEAYLVGKEHKLGLLAKLLLDTTDQVLVFSRTKHGANNLVKKLAGYGVTAAAIHGNKSQNQRTKALADFKNGATQVLVATDIAARGIDIDQLAMVINYDLPQVSEDYVHRIGRTGRAGASGLAVSLVSDEDEKLLRDIERLIKRRVTRREVEVASLPSKPVEAPVPRSMAQATKAPVQERGEAGRREPDEQGQRARRRRGWGRGKNQERGQEGRGQEGQSAQPRHFAQQGFAQQGQPAQQAQHAPARPQGQGQGQASRRAPRDGQRDGQPRDGQQRDGQQRDGQQRDSQFQRQGRGPNHSNHSNHKGHQGQKRGPQYGQQEYGQQAGRGANRGVEVDGNRIDIAGQPFRDAQGNVVEPRQPRPPRFGHSTMDQRSRGQGAASRQQHGNQRGRGDNAKERGLWNSLRGFFGNK